MAAFHDRVQTTKKDTEHLRALRHRNETYLRNSLRNWNAVAERETKVVLQGSHASHTAVGTSSLDVDLAYQMPEWALPAKPAEARRLVCELISADSRRFNRPPEIRTNAVTVWYERGVHVDIAVYRRFRDGSLQHAGSEWRSSDPKEFPTWLSTECARRSPTWSRGARVRDRQMLRVIRLVKAWAKQYQEGDLPRGFPLTALVAECYEPSERGDDVALFETLRSMRNRLERNLELRNPANRSEDLLRRDVDVRRLDRLRSELSGLFASGPLGGLDMLTESEVDDALGCWEELFGYIPAAKGAFARY